MPRLCCVALEGRCVSVRPGRTIEQTWRSGFRAKSPSTLVPRRQLCRAVVVQLVIWGGWVAAAVRHALPVAWRQAPSLMHLGVYGTIPALVGAVSKPD